MQEAGLFRHVECLSGEIVVLARVELDMRLDRTGLARAAQYNGVTPCNVASTIASHGHHSEFNSARPGSVGAMFVL
jgi:hypothetical protein